jgi:hypothetical protein
VDYEDVGGGSHGGGAIPQYDPNKNYTLYHIGDLVRMPNGDVYRVKIWDTPTMRRIAKTDTGDGRKFKKSYLIFVCWLVFSY